MRDLLIICTRNQVDYEHMTNVQLFTFIVADYIAFILIAIWLVIAVVAMFS